MRRRKKQTVKDFVNKNLKSEISKLMDNRRKLLAPFPIDPMELYHLVWTAQEWDALNVLDHHADLFRRSSILDLIGFPINKRTMKVHINLPQAMPAKNRFYGTEMKWEDVPLNLANPIVEWAALWQELNLPQQCLLTKLEEVAGVCTTFGQVYRLWPDLLGFFDKKGRTKIDTARAQSKYPDEVTTWQWDEARQRNFLVLRDEFKPEAFAPFTDVIAECLMLPLTEDKEVATLTF